MMKETKAEAILPMHVATTSTSKGRSNTSTLCVSISLLFLSMVGLLLVHQNIQLDGQVRCMKDTVGKVVMVLSMMNNKVAEVEMDMEVLRDDMEIELYDEMSTTTTTRYPTTNTTERYPRTNTTATYLGTNTTARTISSTSPRTITTDVYFADLVDIDEGEFVLEEKENWEKKLDVEIQAHYEREKYLMEQAPERIIEYFTKPTINGEFEYSTKTVMEVLEKDDIHDIVEFEEEKYLIEQSLKDEGFVEQGDRAPDLFSDVIV